MREIRICLMLGYEERRVKNEEGRVKNEEVEK